jgi:hypothetical protein
MQKNTRKQQHNPVDKLLMTHEQVAFLAGGPALHTNTGALVHKAGVFLRRASH